MSSLTFLGTGTSCGVPVIGCTCEVCQSGDPHDQRLRASAVILHHDTQILIDCGPDFRQQALRIPFRKIDAVLLTHVHYDHVGGIDDLRPYCKFGNIDIFAKPSTCHSLREHMPYCFAEHLYPGVPKLALHEVKPHQPICIKGIEVMPFTVMHGKMPILGYRIGKLAYITDMKTMDVSELHYLKGVETLVVNALRWKKPHHSHQLVSDAVKLAEELGVKHTYLIHMSHEIGLHHKASSSLPPNVHLAYDGLTIHF